MEASQGVDIVFQAQPFPALQDYGHIAVLPQEIMEGAELELLALLAAGVGKELQNLQFSCLIGDGLAGSRGEEDALGASRAYLVDYAADDIINWSVDEHGNYEWVVIRTKLLRKDRVEDPEWRVETQWTYYDKQTFRVFRKTNEAHVSLVDEGIHGLAKLDRVPLFPLRIPEGLWMLNRAGLLQLEHFNKSNALSWALTMGLFAMPVVYRTIGRSGSAPTRRQNSSRLH